jgi:hypothetical protein
VPPPATTVKVPSIEIRKIGLLPVSLKYTFPLASTATGNFAGCVLRWRRRIWKREYRSNYRRDELRLSYYPEGQGTSQRGPNYEVIAQNNSKKSLKVYTFMPSDATSTTAIGHDLPYRVVGIASGDFELPIAGYATCSCHYLKTAPPPLI